MLTAKQMLADEDFGNGRHDSYAFSDDEDGDGDRRGRARGRAAKRGSAAKDADDTYAEFDDYADAIGGDPMQTRDEYNSEDEDAGAPKRRTLNKEVSSTTISHLD